ncbi:MAG: ribosomal RNA small subunit methyltransferase I [Limnohabitans sp.]|nr:ribosomal RNA small subunit methyltransferase I [Limnohabitans sp.]
MASAPTAHGRLFLVPAPLDFMCRTQAPLNQVMPQATLHTASQLSHWVSENAKSTRALLKRIGEIYPLSSALQDQHIAELPRLVHKKGDHAAGIDTGILLAPALQGHDMGLASEAGMPAVADPGSSLVRAAHDAGIEVVPLVGPCSLLLALAGSGLNGQQFAFIGYLPQDAALRLQRIQTLEERALATGETQIFIETPYRNEALHAALLNGLQQSTRLCLCSNLSLADMLVQSLRVADWKKKGLTPDKHSPVVFAFGP